MTECLHCNYTIPSCPFHILRLNGEGIMEGHGDFCAGECALAYLMRQSRWDDSAVATAMALLNYHYGNGKDPIKCAPDPPTVRSIKARDKYRSGFTSRNNIFFNCVHVKPVPMNSTLRLIDSEIILHRIPKYQVRRKPKEKASRSEAVRKEFFKQQ